MLTYVGGWQHPQHDSIRHTGVAHQTLFAMNRPLTKYGASVVVLQDPSKMQDRILIHIARQWIERLIVEIADGYGTPTDTGTKAAGHDPITNIVNDEDESVGLT